MISIFALLLCIDIFFFLNVQRRMGVEKPVFKKRLSESKLLNHLGLWQKYNDGIRCRIITVE